MRMPISFFTFFASTSSGSVHIQNAGIWHFILYIPKMDIYWQPALIFTRQAKHMMMWSDKEGMGPLFLIKDVKKDLSAAQDNSEVKKKCIALSIKAFKSTKH